MMIRRQQKGYSFADLLWLPEKQGTEVASNGLLHPRPCVQKQCRYGLVLGFQGTLQLSPKGFVGQILLCKWSNQRLQRAEWHYKHSEAGPGWGHFQWSFMACQNPHAYWLTAPFWGYWTGRDEMTWLITVHDQYMKGREQQENKWKDSIFILMATISIIWICQLFTCTSAYSPRQLENLTARFQESEMLQTRKLGLGWKNTQKSLRRLKVNYSTFSRPPMTT